MKGVLLAAPAGLASCALQRHSLSSLAIIPRSGWGAIDPDHNAPGERGFYDKVTNPDGWRVYDKPLSQVLNTIVVHHSALPLSDGPLQIQYLHMRQKGYADIGYHFVIDDAGRIYAARDIHVRGAHTGNHNSGTVGVVLMGNFEGMQPTTTQFDSLKAMVASLIGDYGISYLCGHRDFQPGVTLCPGKYLEEKLPSLAFWQWIKFGTAGYVQQ
jgi:hypothetical protein